MKMESYKSELDVVGHFDLHRECWQDGELIAVCFTDISNETTKTYYTPVYDHQFEGYYKCVDLPEIHKFQFYPVSREELLRIHDQTRATAFKADMVLQDYTKRTELKLVASKIDLGFQN